MAKKNQDTEVDAMLDRLLEGKRPVEVSPSLISTVTDAVLDDVKAWQSRPLGAVYPIVYLDAIHLKLRRSGHVQTHAVYLPLALTLEGEKELLGLWVGEAEGAKFWLSVLTELKNRGVRDILIAAIDGLTGFPEAIESVFPTTQIQLCISVTGKDPFPQDFRRRIWHSLSPGDRHPRTPAWRSGTRLSTGPAGGLRPWGLRPTAQASR